jgi:peptidoglycan/LPS O-acetylase OafA/YrhL
MQHRSDIDGLRAVAVLGVLIFHFGFETLSGGFVGVDVFFVISGYLITSIIITEHKESSFSYLKFYEKRIRRLFPALFATSFFTLITGYFLFMPDEFKEFGQSLVAVVTYLSNFFFWLKSDYFAGPSELKPLLHTWSLAVEEQYYLIFPTLALLCLKRGLTFFLAVVIVLIFVSFGASILLINKHPSAAFFISPFRFWELLAGSLISILVNKGFFLPKLLNWIAPYIGLTLILISFFVLNEFSIFPGWVALLPVIGSVLIVWSQPSDGIFNTLMTTRFMSFTGKISYSLYLWHWPIIVFYGYWIIREFELIEKVAMILVTYIIAWLSWRFIETPFRLKRKIGFAPIKTYFSAIITSVILALLGLFLHYQDGMHSRFLEEGAVVKSTESINKSNKCFMSTDENYHGWGFEDCRIQINDNAKYTLLWGDSHANHLWKGLKANSKMLNENFILYSSAGCPPIFDVEVNGRPNCRSNNTNVRNILKDNNIQKVILASSWSYAQKAGDVDLARLSATIKEIRSAKLKIVIINQVPIYSLNNPQFLAKRLSQRNSPMDDYWMKPIGGKQVSEEIRKIVEGTPIFSPMNVFCDEGLCKIYSNGRLMVTDMAHLSKDGSVFLTTKLIQYLNDIDTTYSLDDF